MSIHIKKLALTLILLSLALVSCKPANCDLQMVAGGAKACQEQQSR